MFDFDICLKSVIEGWIGRNYQKIAYYSSQHINESKVLHKYLMNEFLVACCSRQTKYFWKGFSKICSPNIYAYFGTFSVQIGQLFKPLSVFEDL